MDAFLERSFSFTPRAEREMMDTVEDLTFPTRDAEMTFQTLRDRMHFIPFCDYLKRYIYLKSGMLASFRDVPLSAYQETLIDAFRNSGTPCSLQRRGSHLATRARDWLTQDAASREAMMVLGFGLSMSLADVNRFLINACHDHILDLDVPVEAICAYCYDHSYGFAKMEQLLEIYDQVVHGKDALALICQCHPASRPESERLIAEDSALIHRLFVLKGRGNLTSCRQVTRDTFLRLYDQARQSIQRHMQADFSALEDVQGYTLERVLYVSIPRTHHGNLVPLNSALQKQLNSHRLTRQYVRRLLTGESAPTRYDLITLRFLITALEAVPEEDSKTRYLQFLKETNALLQNCGFGSLYPADPYECFILMCILSSDPMSIFSDVLEMTYSKPVGGDEDE